MPEDEAVTHWLARFQGGDAAAAGRLWERYFRRLVGLARARLQGMPRRVAADEEDVALSAFASFCRGVEAGKFPRLDDRDGLWRVLFTLTVRKAHRLARDEGRQKRGGGAVLGESALAGGAEADAAGEGLAAVAGAEPTPALAAELAEEFERLLALLGDAELRSIAVGRMDGETNDELAARLGCAPSTVERRLALIRRLWEKEAAAP